MTMTTDKSPPENCLHRAASHVAHDVRMLSRAYENRTSAFAYTAWFVHCRAVMDFLECSGNKPQDDIYACDYFDNGTEWLDTWNELDKPPDYSKYREAVNKLAAHLTYSRIEYEEKDFTPNREITDFLVGATNVFVRQLSEKRRVWFAGLLRI